MPAAPHDTVPRLASGVAVVPGQEAFEAYPDQSEIPELVVDCSRRRIRVFLRTPFPPNSTGTTDDGWRTELLLRYDLGATERLRVRTDLEPHTLQFGRPKRFLERLLAYQVLEVQYTPFASAMTFSTFRVDALREALPDITRTCGLKPTD